MMFLGRQIKEARKLKGYSQTKLAEKSDVHIKTIQNCEQGISEPSGVNLLKIMKVLGMPLEYYMEEENKMSYTDKIKEELKTIKDFCLLKKIKNKDYNGVRTLLRIDEKLVTEIMQEWMRNEVFGDSYCTRPWAKEVIDKYAIHRSEFM